MRKKLRLEDLTRKQLAIGAAGLFLLSVAVTLIILAVPSRRQPPAPAGGPRTPPSKPVVLGVQDFLLEAPEVPAPQATVLFRQPAPRWSKEQVERYWIPVEQAILDILRRENDRRTEALLREVP